MLKRMINIYRICIVFFIIFIRLIVRFMEGGFKLYIFVLLVLIVIIFKFLRYFVIV